MKYNEITYKTVCELAFRASKFNRCRRLLYNIYFIFLCSYFFSKRFIVGFLITSIEPMSNSNLPNVPDLQVIELIGQGMKHFFEKLGRCLRRSLQMPQHKDRKICSVEAHSNRKPRGRNFIYCHSPT